jgi:hypothetical protein
MHLRELKFPLMGGDRTLGEALSLSLEGQGPSADPYTASMGTSPIPANRDEEGDRDTRDGNGRRQGAVAVNRTQRGRFQSKRLRLDGGQQ